MHQEHQQRPHQQQDRRETYQPPGGGPRKPRPRGLDDWQSSIDSAIEQAISEGQFDNLPGHGKPLQIETNPFQPELDAGFSQLRNAGYAPTWMEIDREITRLRAGLEAWLDATRVTLQEIIAQASAPNQEPDIASDPSPVLAWWDIPGRLRALFTFDPPSTVGADQPLTVDDVVRIRENMRSQYLERAALLDRKISQFHAQLPRALWHLERTQLPRDRAERQFDTVCPPLLSK